MKRTILKHQPGTVLGYRKDGRPIHPIAGGAPEDGASGDGADGADDGKPETGNASGADGGSGDKPDPEAEVAKWKALARKHEGNAKANAEAAKELAALKAANQSDTEKAVSEAEQRGRSAATTELAQKLAAAEVRAALTGVVPDPAAIVEDLNLAKYVTDTGDVDQEAVTALRKKYESFAPKPSPDLKQGKQGSGAKDIDQQIAEATAAGNHALAISLKRQKAYATT